MSMCGIGYPLLSSGFPPDPGMCAWGMGYDWERGPGMCRLVADSRQVVCLMLYSCSVSRRSV